MNKLTLSIVSIITFFNICYSQTINYQYDNLNRLTKVDYGNGSIINYTYDANGNRITEVITGISLPSAPVLILPVNGAIGSLLFPFFDWNDVPTANSYRLQLSTSPVFSSILYDTAALTTSQFNLYANILNPLTTYYWRVYASNIAGYGNSSNIWSFKTIGTPFNVTLLSPSNNSTNQPVNIIFAWRKTSDQTSYNPINSLDEQKYILNKPANTKTDIDYSSKNTISKYWFEITSDTVSLSNIIRDSTLTDTIKTISNLTNNSRYYWRVKAKNEIGWGNFSAFWNFTTMVAIPAAPTLIMPANNSTGNQLSLNLIWNKSLNATGYHLVLATDAGFNNIVLNDSTLTDTLKSISTLNPLTMYYWKVRAKNTSGGSVFSSVHNFKTLGTASQVMLFLPANNAVNQSTSITFKWIKATDLTSSIKTIFRESGLETDDPLVISKYWFEFSTDSMFNSVIERDSILTDTIKTISNLNNITKYYWRVKAKNQIGWGQFSEKWNFTTIAPIPLAPILVSPPNNITNLAPNNVTLSWNAVTYASGYRIQLANDSLFSSMVFDTSNYVPDSIKLRNGLLSLNGKYYWRINAANNSGIGPWSIVWNFRVNPTGIILLSNDIPSEYNLHNNYPNPFNPLTKIRFDVPKNTFVNLTVYDLAGKEVTVLINEQVSAGKYETAWNGANFSSGVYFVRIRSGDYAKVIRMLLIK